jgi:hypothetical protein
MADITVDFENKLVLCSCGHVTQMGEPDIFNFCSDCGQYHLFCYGCSRIIELPWIMQDYIRTYRQTLNFKPETERMN